MSDLCISRPMLRRVLRQADLMDRMLQRAGIDPAAAARVDGGMGLYEARSRCIACCREQECLDWLQSSKTPAEPPEFCANARFFRRCKNGVGPSSRNPSQVSDAAQRSGPIAPHVRCQEEFP